MFVFARSKDRPYKSISMMLLEASYVYLKAVVCLATINACHFLLKYGSFHFLGINLSVNMLCEPVTYLK